MTSPEVLARGRLQRRLAELLRVEHALEARLRRDLPADGEERAPLLADEETLAALDAGTRREVEAVQAAISRLDRGEYGRCVTCGGAIPAARLDALPAAATCVACGEAG
jgi:RNA polymerase-binding transcription factor DksA